MNRINKTILTTISVTLGVAGLGLVLWSVLDENSSRWVLTGALLCIAAGTVINMLLLRKKRRE